MMSADSFVGSHITKYIDSTWLWYSPLARSRDDVNYHSTIWKLDAVWRWYKPHVKSATHPLVLTSGSIHTNAELSVSFTLFILMHNKFWYLVKCW